MLSITFLLAALAVTVSSQDVNPAVVQATLMADGVIPDVLPSNFTPRFPFEVVFGNAANPLPVTAGMNLTMAETATMPNFAILSNNTAIIGKPYLIAIVDPDAPSPPDRSVAQFLHFIGKDYISKALTNGTIFVLQNMSAPVEPYFPPTPPNGSVAHRYVVACYLQNSTGITLPKSFNASVRTNFNLSTFASEVPGLTLLGATVFWVAPGANGTTALPSSNGTAGGPAPTATAPGAPGATGSAPAGTGAALAEAPVVWALFASMIGWALYALEF